VPERRGLGWEAGHGTPGPWVPGPWVRSSHSSAETGCCVEAALPRPVPARRGSGTARTPLVLLRDSRHPAPVRAGFPPAEWVAFLLSVRGGAL